MENQKETLRVRRNILLTHDDPILLEHIRGCALLENEADGRLAFCRKFLRRIVRITPLGIGVFRCMNFDGIEWLVVNIDKF